VHARPPMAFIFALLIAKVFIKLAQQDCKIRQQIHLNCKILLIFWADISNTCSMNAASYARAWLQYEGFVHALRRKFMLYRSGMTPQSRGGYSAPPLDLDNEWVAVIGATRYDEWSQLRHSYSVLVWSHTTWTMSVP
jgi:hypothetical protein